MESPRWWSKETIAVVTGANKGIGLEIVRQLAREGITTILTARDEGRGHKAVSDLMKQEVGLDINVMFHQLDVTDSTSIHNLATWIKHQFGGLDILVNNAGIVLRLNSPTPDEVLAAAKEVLDTNYYGAKNLTDALLPLFRPSAAGSRIVNVSSSAGQLSVVRSDKWRKQLDDDNVKEQVIESFIQSYLEDCAQGKNAVLQQPSKEVMDAYGDYMISKIALNAHMRSLAHDLITNRKEGDKIFINLLCPGTTATDMNGGIGYSVEEGADTAVWLALLPASECVAGKFFLCRKDRGFVFIEELYEHAPELKPTH